jgi:hypothetical protein
MWLRFQTASTAKNAAGAERDDGKALALLHPTAEPSVTSEGNENAP